MTITDTQIQNYVSSYIFILTRVSSMFVATPVLSADYIPVRIRILLSVLITTLVFSHIPTTTIDPFSLTGAFVLIQQFFIGLVIGMIFQFVFHIMVVGGQILALQSGLGFATMVDPQSHQSMPIFSQFYMLVMTLLFLSFDGHLVLIRMIVDSFYSLPIANVSISSDSIYQVITFSSEMFSGAISISLPAIIALLMVNITFAVMTKAAPQFNIFTIGFPLTLLCGLTIMMISFPGMSNYAFTFFEKGFNNVEMFVGSK